MNEKLENAIGLAEKARSIFGSNGFIASDDSITNLENTINSRFSNPVLSAMEEMGYVSRPAGCGKFFLNLEPVCLPPKTKVRHFGNTPFKELLKDVNIAA